LKDHLYALWLKSFLKMFYGAFIKYWLVGTKIRCKKGDQRGSFLVPLGNKLCWMIYL
jgi:hypothetical protein